jgi:hypothetical protein
MAILTPASAFGPLFPAATNLSAAPVLKVIDHDTPVNATKEEDVATPGVYANVSLAPRFVSGTFFATKL